jgi:hypothetical protein
VFKFFTEVHGDQIINKKIEKLIATGSKSAARAGISKGMTVIARGIRKAIPPKAKSVKKTVGQRFKKTKERYAIDAKVGLCVGKKTKSKKERDSKRPGVGISKENVHWWELGTKERTTDKGKRTGKMPKGPPVVRQGFNATKTQARKIIIATMKAKIKAEAKKKKARARAKARGG